MEAKTALITGAVRRIGLAFTRHLARKGWDIALHYNNSVSQAKTLRKELQEQYPHNRFEIFACNLEDGEEAGSLVSRVIKHFGKVDLLINNASVFDSGWLRESSLELFDVQMNVNFRAPFLLTCSFARQCNQGVIVNLLDTRIQNNKSSHAAYNLSKKALAALTQMAAAELGPGIRVNGIAPGAVLPPEGKGEEYLHEVAKLSPLGVPGEPGTLLQSMDYILENTNLTGQILFCDGGQHLL